MRRQLPQMESAKCLDAPDSSRHPDFSSCTQLEPCATYQYPSLFDTLNIQVGCGSGPFRFLLCWCWTFQSYPSRAADKLLDSQSGDIKSQTEFPTIRLGADWEDRPEPTSCIGGTEEESGVFRGLRTVSALVIRYKNMPPTAQVCCPKLNF